MTHGGAGLVRWWPFFLPPFYLLLVLWLQPGDHPGEPDNQPSLGRLLYDDYDVTAFAQRGLNALAGRAPGGKPPPWITNEEFRDAISVPFPLHDHYFLEYPPATLPLFALGWWLQPGEIAVPATVLDCVHNRIVEHRPSNENEFWLGKSFRHAIQIHMILMTLCLLGLMAVLQAGYEADGELSGPIWLLLLPATLYFSLNRFDVLPALLLAAS